MTLEAEQFRVTIHAKDPHADILRFSLATSKFTSPEVVRDGALMLNMLERMTEQTETFWAAQKVHRKLSFCLHDGSTISSDMLSLGNIFDVISIGSCASITRFSAEQLSAKFRLNNGCQVKIQPGEEASLVMVAVAYPLGDPLRLINKEVHISLCAVSLCSTQADVYFLVDEPEGGPPTGYATATTAGVSNPFSTKQDGMMAATAVMNSSRIISVSEEQARQASKGMAAWVKQQPAAQSIVYQAEYAIQEVNEDMWDLLSSPTPEARR